MAIYGDLKQILSPPSEVALANDEDRTGALNITQRWNAFEAPNYVVYAKPASNEDVKKVVSCQPTLESSISQLTHSFSCRLSTLVSRAFPS